MAIAGFNSTYYVQQYPDVLLAISQGVFKTAEEHFTKFGAKEGRNPNAFFDSKYYLAQNQDVLQAVAAGTFASAYDHYIKNGGAEGRVPSAALASFDGAKYLAANADVKTAGFTEKTAVSHYVLYGAAEGRSGTSSSTGQTVTLTTAQDSITGSDAADIIRGVAGAAVGAQDQTTLNSSDVLDGGKGEDALVVNMTGGGAYQGGATIKNIETLQIGSNLAAATFDYNVNAGSYEVTGVNKVVYDQITTGETLTVNNIVPTATGTVTPTLSWENEAGSAAGTIAATYRQASIQGTADNQAIVLKNVSAGAGGGVNGVMNIASGMEKFTITSDGTTANTLNNATGGTVDLTSGVSASNSASSSLKTVVINGAQEFGKKAGVIGSTGLTDRTAGVDGGITAGSTASNLISVASSVTEVDASAATGAVDIRFTQNSTNATNVTFKGGAGDDYVEFELGNVSATGGAGADTFAFITTASGVTNSTYGSGDTVTGGAGSDTLQLGLNGSGTYTLSTTEFANTTGVDVLDLRGATNTVTLSSAVVAAADAGTFTVRTDRIVQTSTTNSANAAGTGSQEDASTNTINITQLNAGQGISIVGGSGSDRIVGNNATINAATIIDAGTNAGTAGRYDTLTVVNSAVLDRTDLANVKGLEGLILVENVTGASQFNIELTSDFLLNNTQASNSTSTSIDDTVFQIGTVGAADGTALNAGDTVTIDISGLLNATRNGLATSITGRGIDVSSLTAAGVTVNYVVDGATATTAQRDLVLKTDATGRAGLLSSAAFATGAAAASFEVTGTAGNDTITITGTTNDAVDAGAGNDAITLTGGVNLVAASTIEGGAGTDTLTVSGGSTLNAGTIQNVELLDLTGNTTMTSAQHGGFVAINGSGANTVTISDAASFTTSGTVENYVLGNFANSVTLSTGTTAVTGGTDADTISGTAAQLLAGTGGGFNAGTGTDTLNITSMAANTALTAAMVSNFETINVTGYTSGTLTLINGNFSATANTVNASTITANMTVDISGLTTANGATTVTLGSGNDTLATSITNGGNNNLTIDFGAGNATITDIAANGTGIFTFKATNTATATTSLNFAATTADLASGDVFDFNLDVVGIGATGASVARQVIVTAGANTTLLFDVDGNNIYSVGDIQITLVGQNIAAGAFNIVSGNLVIA